MELFDLKRVFRIISESVERLQLDLHGINVLTEVGSHTYLFTPLIPAFAGATVSAFVRDTVHGKASEIVDKSASFASKFSIEDRITFHMNRLPNDVIGKADIITNSGMLRPIDKDFIDLMKPSAVIPLMFEAWELRNEELDSDYCSVRGIKVAGTWENHPDLMVFTGVGALAVKMSQEAGYEVYQNHIVVWSDDHFGQVIGKAFENFGATVVVTTNADELYDELPKTDFVFVCDYSESRPYLGENEVWNRERLMSAASDFGVVHLYGDLDPDAFRSLGIKVNPDIKGRPQTMTRTLGHLGPEPIIKLQTAGFKVGQELLQNRLSKLSQLI